MTQPLTFAVTVDQNEYLPAGGRVMDAAISVTAAGGSGAHGPAPTAAQVIMIDTSSSMAGSRIEEAKRATAVAIDTLRDGVLFAVVSGAAEARMAYPRRPHLVRASAANRAEAKHAVSRLAAIGGTAMGTWLRLANSLLATEPAQIKHGILLTDGKNETESAERLEDALDDCRGGFVCDARGVGTDWEAKTLLRIADVLLGSAVGLPDPRKLSGEFRSITEAVMGKAAADVTLRLWTLPSVRLRFIKQMYPRIIDLTDRGTPAGPQLTDYPTGQWGAENRDFHLSVEVPPGTADEEPIRLAKVRMVVGDQLCDERLIRARWTENPELSTVMNRKVAHYTGQAELADAIVSGLAARTAGDVELATANLGRAVQLAEESGHENTLKLLAKVVDVVDATTGTVRLRHTMAQVDAEMVEVVSQTTVRLRQDD
jgi:uncharacterized protein YegL